jgi:hypothetical protein
MDDLSRRLREHGTALLDDDPLTLEQVRTRLSDDEEITVVGRPRPLLGGGRLRSIALALGVGLIVLLLFIPQLFMGSPDDATITEETTPLVSTPTSVETTTNIDRPVGAFGVSETSLGNIAWYWTNYPSDAAKRFLIDGTHYATDYDHWSSSADGVDWELADDATLALPFEPSLSTVFETQGDTFATTRKPVDDLGQDFTLYRRLGNQWVEVPFQMPQPPDGVMFTSDTVPAHPGSEPTNISRPSSVVIRDDGLMTVASPTASSGVVLMGQVAYAVSIEGDQGRVRSFRLWQSDDGLEWEEVELDAGSLPIGDWWDSAYVYLTGGHDRLMLTIGTVEKPSAQEVLTSVDGTNWARVNGAYRDALAVPQATDFGWMQTSPGPREGQDDVSPGYDPTAFALFVSGDGEQWEEVPSVPVFRDERGGIAPPAPLIYQDGLFLRREHWIFIGQKTYVGKLTD